MVENRQKALNDAIIVRFSRQQDITDTFSIRDSIKVSVNFIDSLLLDSLCDEEGKNCEKNDRQPKGIITGVSSYDVGLPGSGLLVWHINDWFIEEVAYMGLVNISSDETKEFVGINLVEADGDLSIGQEGKDNLNQSVFDFGSGSDMLPHIKKYVRSVSGSDTVWRRDTIRFISPYGHANTNAWNDGKTHIVLEGALPRATESEMLPSVNFISGDSVFNFQDSSMILRVYWNKNPNIQKKEGWQWPVLSALGTSPQGLSFLNYPDTSFLLALSDEGYLQIFSQTGDAAVTVYDTLLIAQPYDSLQTLLPSGKNRDSLMLPLASLGGELGKPLGSAMLLDTISCVLTSDGSLHLTTLITDSMGGSNQASFLRVSLNAGAELGPIVLGDQVWVVTENNLALSYDKDGNRVESISLPGMAYHAMAAVYNSSSNRMDPVLTGAGGRVVVVDAAGNRSREITDGTAWSELPQFFTAAGSDFNRDGQSDILVLGSRGDINIINLDGTSFPNFPLTYQRLAVFTDDSNNIDLVTEDRSPPALADLDDDGYPDIIFTMPNRVQAINYKGAVVDGWPFKLEEHQPVGLLYSTVNYPATVVQSTPLVLELDGEKTVLIASPDGLIWALDKRGDPVSTSSFNAGAEEVRYGSVLSTNKTDWPLSVGGLNFDTTDVPYIHICLFNIDDSEELELFAQTGTGGLYAWSLPGAKLSSGAVWQTPGGDFTRKHFLDPAGLGQMSDPTERNVIREFHFYPSPVTGPTVNIYLDIGAPARKARLRIYDLAGMVVKDQSYRNLIYSGPQPPYTVNLSHLGPDVYTALMEVWFNNDVKKTKWTRIGVIR
jgi:hypothetical protein